MLAITDEKWIALSETLQVEKAVLQAVAEVESGGSGFLDVTPPRPKVLFEGHYFHRLTGRALRRVASDDRVSRPGRASTTRRPALGEWARLEQAIALDRAAALQSASWGAFQIMGANYAQSGFADVEAFVAAQSASAEAQLECFTRFIARRWYLVPLAREGRGRCSPSATTARATRRTSTTRSWPAPTPPGAPRRPRRAHDEARWALEPVPAVLPGARRAAAAQVPPGRPMVAAVPVARQLPVQRIVRADALDLRDWLYRPRIGQAPPGTLLPLRLRPVSSQGRSSACTGFALASVIEYLLDRAGASGRGHLRAHALRHGAPLRRVGRERPAGPGLVAARRVARLVLPRRERAGAVGRARRCRAPACDEGDWWLDAVKRPLGVVLPRPDRHDARHPQRARRDRRALRAAR